AVVPRRRLSGKVGALPCQESPGPAKGAGQRPNSESDLRIPFRAVAMASRLFLESHGQMTARPLYVGSGEAVHFRGMLSSQPFSTVKEAARQPTVSPP